MSSPKASPFSKLPVPGSPPEPLREGEGVSELSRTVPEFTVRLNAGEFMWLWRITEAKAVQHHSNPSTSKMVPQQVRVALGAVRAFRQAAGTIIAEETVEQPKTKTFGLLPKKKAGAKPPPTPSKRLFG